MSEKIRSRVFQHGDEKESSWPPLFGTGGTGIYHFAEDGKMVEGPPPVRFPKMGEAPYVIQDSIDAFRHSASGEWIDSRAKLRDTDRACGTTTTDKREDCTPFVRAREKKTRDERKTDIHQAMRRAINDLEYGMAPLTEEARHKCEINDRIISDRLGFDAFNAVGRKKDPREKKYRKR